MKVKNKSKFQESLNSNIKAAKLQDSTIISHNVQYPNSDNDADDV